MNWNRWVCMAAICAAAGVASAAESKVPQEGGGVNLGVTAKFGTPGYGGDLTLGLGRYLSVRGGYSQGTVNYNVDLEEATLTGELALQTIPVLLDLHPFGGGFRISGGMVRNGNEVRIRALPGETVELNNADYQVEKLNGRITFDDYGWYAGIGYGNAAGADGHWHFACDFGVMFQGEPAVAATVKASDPALQAAADQALQHEVDSLQADVKDFKYYPVISVGVSYRF